MSITDEDLVTIKAAIDAGGNIWENELLDDIKARIKTHYLGAT